MANYTYTQNGITFNDIKSPAMTTGGIAVGNNYSANPFTGQLNSISVDATNAVSIDWNGMQLGDGQVINTTGELASYISTASTAAVNASTEIDNIRNDLSSNYITTSEADNRYLKFSGSSSTIISDENISNWDTAYAYINTHLSTSAIHVTTEDRVKWNGKVDRSELNNVSTEINNIRTELSSNYITTSAADNKYQPKGNYLPLTGGIITESGVIPDNPSPSTMPIYTYITYSGISFAYNNIAETVVKSLDVNTSNIWISESNKTENSDITYDCVITPNDVVLKFDNAEVKKLSEACQGGATVTNGDTAKWNAATTKIDNHLSDTSKHVSDNDRNAWNAKANSSELANYLPLTGGIIKGNYEGGVAPVSAKTIGIHPDKIELTNGIDSVQKNVNITVNGISVKSSVPHMTSGSSTLETTYCTITPDDVIIKNNDVEINGLSYLLKKINDLTDRVKTLEGKTGGTIIKDPTPQVPSTGHETEVVTP